MTFNYGTSDDGLPYLKAAFYNQRRFYQKENVSLDHWAAEVRQASSILTLHGHEISEADKSLAFRHGLSRADLQTALIFPAQRENFEDLVITARAFIQGTAETPGPSLQAVNDAAYCPYCFTDKGRKLRHDLTHCFRSHMKNAVVITGKRPAQDVECFCCHQYGHYADSCPTPHLSRARRAKRVRGRRTRHSPVNC